MVRLSTVLGAALLGALALVLALAEPRGDRDEKTSGSSALQLLTGFSAKETCSCVFVVGQSDAYCRAFGQQGAYTVDITLDRAGKSVTSAFGGATRTAHFTDAAGCTLDP